MKALILHDETGRINSVAVTEDDIDLQMLPDRGEFVFEVDIKELKLGNVKALTQANVERLRTSLAKLQESLRVDAADMRARRLIKGQG